MQVRILEIRMAFGMMGALLLGCSASRSGVAVVLAPVPNAPAQPSADVDTSAKRSPEPATTARAPSDAQAIRVLTEAAAAEVEMVRVGRSDNVKATLEVARDKLERAMEMDPGNPTTINSLALQQLEVARYAGAKIDTGSTLVTYQSNTAAADQQALELARRIAEFGIARHPNDAPLHNTLGLIEVELRQYRDALGSFDRARRLAPGFEAAHYNFATLAFDVKDFAGARLAFGEVLRIAPRSYEARIGLALAKTLELDAASAQVEGEAALALLREAKRLEPTRPEAYFNAALLTGDVLARHALEPNQAIRLLDEATCLYAAFFARADRVKHAHAIQIALARSADFMDAVKFFPRQQQVPRECDRPVL